MERLRQKLILTLTGGKNGRGTIFYYGFWTVILFSKSLNLIDRFPDLGFKAV